VGEDEEGVRKLLQLVLSEGGFVVLMASNGAEALRRYQEQADQIDLVLLDVQMPNLDGPETLVELRKVNPSVRCCFMTASSGRYTYEELMRYGAERIFDKPFNSLQDLVRSLRELVAA
jgi:CheY-like chemotaxis protein